MPAKFPFELESSSPLLLGKRRFSTRQGDFHRFRRILVVVCCWSIPHLFTTLPPAAHGQDTPDYFRQNCVSCHTIGGGRLTGPDLKNLSERQPDRGWLINFLMNPRAVIDSGDPYAKKILEASLNVPMPTPPGITRDRAEKLLDLIEAESQLEESQFKGMKISTAPFTDEDRARGREIFLGTQRLKEEGTSCVSCHSMFDAPALGGGQLGPDLTNVYERLKGRAALSSWLMAPGTETMQPIFKNRPMSTEEIHALVAYFESTTAERPADSSTGRVAFLLSGLAGAVFGVFFLDTIWKRRFHSVRRSLVEANTSRGES
jgi:mono/diheme cytochrome c family protein